jgi:xanthine/CO dehydrogenase XdhC/CoxF family maturation factor
MNTFGDREEILKQAIDWRGAGKGVALATVVTTWGSSPRPVGSKLAVDDSGNFLGSVSGGCIEGAVVHDALDAIREWASPAAARCRSSLSAWNEARSSQGGDGRDRFRPLRRARDQSQVRPSDVDSRI